VSYPQSFQLSAKDKSWSTPK